MKGLSPIPAAVACGYGCEAKPHAPGARGGQPVEYSQYIGIDLHKAFFQVCVLLADGTRRWEGRFATSAAGIAELAARDIRHGVVAVEATGPTWRFVDAVTPLVARVVVVDTRKTRLKAG